MRHIGEELKSRPLYWEATYASDTSKIIGVALAFESCTDEKSMSRDGEHQERGLEPLAKLWKVCQGMQATDRTPTAPVYGMSEARGRDGFYPRKLTKIAAVISCYFGALVSDDHLDGYQVEEEILRSIRDFVKPGAVIGIIARSKEVKLYEKQGFKVIFKFLGGKGMALKIDSV